MRLPRRLPRKLHFRKVSRNVNNRLLLMAARPDLMFLQLPRLKLIVRKVKNWVRTTLTAELLDDA
jgi:hypothetical protein